MAKTYLNGCLQDKDVAGHITLMFSLTIRYTIVKHSKNLYGSKKKVKS
jgi:hypothetical protein